MKWHTKKIQSLNVDRYRQELLEIYFDAASTGAHEQQLNLANEASYIHGIFSAKEGYGFLALVGESCAGFILAYPLKHEPLLPHRVRERYDTDRCLYVAEMHVRRDFRGQGCGSELFTAFLSDIDARYASVAIRAWRNNEGALRFYERLGFVRNAIIQETKARKGTGEPFVIEKQYLFKDLQRRATE